MSGHGDGVDPSNAAARIAFLERELDELRSQAPTQVYTGRSSLSPLLSTPAVGRGLASLTGFRSQSPAQAPTAPSQSGFASLNPAHPGISQRQAPVQSAHHQDVGGPSGLSLQAISDVVERGGSVGAVSEALVRALDANLLMYLSQGLEDKARDMIMAILKPGEKAGAALGTGSLALVPLVLEKALLKHDVELVSSLSALTAGVASATSRDQGPTIAHVANLIIKTWGVASAEGKVRGVAELTERYGTTFGLNPTGKLQVLLGCMSDGLLARTAPHLEAIRSSFRPVAAWMEVMRDPTRGGVDLEKQDTRADFEYATYIKAIPDGLSVQEWLLQALLKLQCLPPEARATNQGNFMSSVTGVIHNRFGEASSLGLITNRWTDAINKMGALPSAEVQVSVLENIAGGWGDGLALSQRVPQARQGQAQGQGRGQGYGEVVPAHGVAVAAPQRQAPGPRVGPVDGARPPGNNFAIIHPATVTTHSQPLGEWGRGHQDLPGGPQSKHLPQVVGGPSAPGLPVSTGGEYYLPVAVAGRLVHALIDPGAGFTLVWPTLAADLCLRTLAGTPFWDASGGLNDQHLDTFLPLEAFVPEEDKPRRGVVRAGVVRHAAWAIGYPIILGRDAMDKLGLSLEDGGGTKVLRAPLIPTGSTTSLFVGRTDATAPISLLAVTPEVPTGTAPPDPSQVNPRERARNLAHLLAEYTVTMGVPGPTAADPVDLQDPRAPILEGVISLQEACQNAQVPCPLPDTEGPYFPEDLARSPHFPELVEDIAEGMTINQKLPKVRRVVPFPVNKVQGAELPRSKGHIPVPTTLRDGLQAKLKKHVQDRRLLLLPGGMGGHDVPNTAVIPVLAVPKPGGGVRVVAAAGKLAKATRMVNAFEQVPPHVLQMTEHLAASLGDEHARVLAGDVEEFFDQMPINLAWPEDMSPVDFLALARKDLARKDREYVHVVLIAPSEDGVSSDYYLCLTVIQGMTLSPSLLIGEVSLSFAGLRSTHFYVDDWWRRILLHSGTWDRATVRALASDINEVMACFNGTIRVGDVVVQDDQRRGWRVKLSKTYFGVRVLDYLGVSVASPGPDTLGGVTPNDESRVWLNGLLHGTGLPRTGDQIRSVVGRLAFILRLCPLGGAILSTVHKLAGKPQFEHLSQEARDWAVYDPLRAVAYLFLTAPPMAGPRPGPKVLVLDAALGAGWGCMLFQFSGSGPKFELNPDQDQVTLPPEQSLGSVGLEEALGELHLIGGVSQGWTDAQRHPTAGAPGAEVTAVALALKYYRMVLLGEKVIVVGDCQAVPGLVRGKAQGFNPHMERLLATISMFDLTFVYIPGPFNVIADMLSRVTARPPPPSVAEELSRAVPGIDWVNIRSQPDPATRKVVTGASGPAPDTGDSWAVWSKAHQIHPLVAVMTRTKAREEESRSAEAAGPSTTTSATINPSSSPAGRRGRRGVTWAGESNVTPQPDRPDPDHESPELEEVEAEEGDPDQPYRDWTPEFQDEGIGCRPIFPKYSRSNPFLLGETAYDPGSYRRLVLEDVHNRHHWGVKSTVKHLRDNGFSWKGVARDYAELSGTCLDCLALRHKVGVQQVVQRHPAVARGPRALAGLMVDHMYIPGNPDMVAVLTSTCVVSHYLSAVAVPDLTAATTSWALETTWARTATPQTIACDNGFLDVNKEFLVRRGIQVRAGTAGNPKQVFLAEQNHHRLVGALQRLALHEGPDSAWPWLLDRAVAEVNDTPREALGGITPRMLVLGWAGVPEGASPGADPFGVDAELAQAVALRIDLLRQIERKVYPALIDLADERALHLGEARLQAGPPMQPLEGEVVLVKNRGRTKLAPPYNPTPAVVVRDGGHGQLDLADLDGRPIEGHVRAEDVKVIPTAALPEPDGDSGQYRVYAIHGHHDHPVAGRYYFVQWEGYRDPSHDSWVHWSEFQGSSKPATYDVRHGGARPPMARTTPAQVSVFRSSLPEGSRQQAPPAQGPKRTRRAPRI